MLEFEEVKGVLNRLERLETQNRRIKRAMLLLATGGALLFVGFALPPSAQEVVRTERLVLVDSAGNQRGFIGFDQGEPAIVLGHLDRGGEARLWGRGLSIMNSDGVASLGPKTICDNGGR